MLIATRYLVRPMTVADIPQVMEVERESFPAMWPPTAFKRELQENSLARYVVITERNPALDDEPDAPQADQGPGHEAGPLGRFLDGVRHMLGSDDHHLPPPERRAEVILGFVGVWFLPDEAHIVTIAVRQGQRRRGIGEMLVISAIELAQEHGQPMVTLECRVSNGAALALYGKYGFQQVGLRPRYYSDNHEDAFVLTANSVPTRRFREAFERLKAEHRRRWGEFEIELS